MRNHSTHGKARTWRSLPLLFLVWLSALGTTAQTRSEYEFDMDIPVYADSIQQALTYPLAWRNYPVRDLSTWRKAAREKIWERMGPLAPRSRDFDMLVEACERRQGYEALRISVQLTRWYRVKGYLLLPDGKGRHPAVNLLHDHGAHLYIGKEKMIRPFATDTAVVNDADRWAALLYEGQYMGDYLARHGFVVLSMDAPLWGDRGRREGVDRKKYDIIAGNMMMMGRNLCAQMHWDDVLGTDFLASLPAVDSTRIAAVGCSMGAYRAWMLAALSDRVKSTAAVCWMTTTAAQLTTRYGRRENGGFANCIPGLRNDLDYPDIASIAAPRPMLLINGTRDKLFPIPGVEAAYRLMRGVWADAGAPDALETHLLDQPHECNKADQQLVLDFLQRTLGAH
ncbi:MAG: hypothetical protein I3J02_11315 [Prevotella sp.]|nr:hypothetical protein [Prevotella sp.]